MRLNLQSIISLYSFLLISWTPHYAKAAQPMLLWSSERSHGQTSGIYSTFVLPKKQRYSRGYVRSTRVLSLKLPHFISSFDSVHVNLPSPVFDSMLFDGDGALLASNDAKREISLMDVGRGNLAVVNSQSRSVQRTHRGITTKASALAVDWLSGNIYWTDEGRKWIFVSTSDFKNLRPVVQDVTFPRGIALYPQKGLMLWSQLSDGFQPSKIMKASLSGENPTTVAISYGTPTAVTVDYDNDRIYWIDSSDMTIYYKSINDQPSEPEVLYKNANLSFKDLHVFKSWIFVTADVQDKILMLNKTSGLVVHTINTFSPTAVTVVGGNAQPLQAGPCDINNGGCEQFCFEQPPGNLRKCGCNMGMELGLDGTSCKSAILKGDFFLVVDSDMSWIAQVSSDGRKYTKLNLPAVAIPVQVEYDHATSRVYWTDVGTATVNRANLDGGNHVVLARKNVRQPTGIALDRYSRNLYWTDEGTGTINVVRTDGSHRKTLLSKNVELPRGLVLDPTTGRMWWTDWGKHTIESAFMDGSHRRVILDKTLMWVNGLSADFTNNKLYWCDAKRDTIEAASLDGTDREIVLKQKAPAHVFGITLTKNYVYWSDWSEPSLFRMRKNDAQKRVQEFGPHVFDKPSDIHAFFEDEAQPLGSDVNPCQISNGNCTGLCIPIPKNRTSLNVVSKHNNMKGYATARVCLCGNNYNGTCDKPTNTTDGVPPSFGKTCPTTMTFFSPPCSEKVFVNYTIPSATDNSGKVTVEVPAMPPPLYLGEGEYEHLYTAIDEAGNHDTCRVNFIVKVSLCPPEQEYVFGSLVEVVNHTCGHLYGSRVHLMCINSTRRDDNMYMECQQDGAWEGDSYCPPILPTTEIPPRTTVSLTDFPTNVDTKNQNSNEKTSSKLKPTRNSNALTNGTTTILSPGEISSGSNFPYALLIPVLIAIVIAIGGALCYIYYRSNSIPLLAAMEKTVIAYNRKSDNADTSALEIREADGAKGEGDVKESAPHTSKLPPSMGHERRSSLPTGRTNPACEIEPESETKLSNYGTLA